MNAEELRQLVRATVRETLRELGIDTSRPMEAQADFRALRDWRKTMTVMRRTALVSLLGAALSGIVAAFWVGFKSYVK